MTDATDTCLYLASQGLDPATVMEALHYRIPDEAKADWALVLLAIKRRHRQALVELAARDGVREAA